MCGRFSQFLSRDEYLEYLGVERPTIPHDPLPVGRYNVAPGTKVLIISERDENLHLDPVFWGYGPEWWDKPPLINARSETAFSGRMFRPLLKNGRAIVPADGWFEWQKTDSVKQPFFIYQKSRKPLFMAALGRAPFGLDHGNEGFVILTASSNQGMIDIHDRRPVVLTPEGAQAWLNQDLSEDDAWSVIQNEALSESAFTWHKVSKAVGSPRNQGAELIEAISDKKSD
ncbi:SOS response-associated peptidase family protein [Phytobacter diazotrophicus]|uniref:SOS response-associated peptidase family protein n=1 Tax=Phytobacter diazotrophicus TaxID=395631 RepID=UPI000CD17ACC|nr:DUF159 family protein [Enterobacteriaceae bacterium ENNIH3]AUV05048.1 DUF159 family protein [Enterobacteriaceae bacterium ENNIH2]QIH66871.1 DUF159 family protein [Enterobacteriaceae bacterium A-F18]